MGLKKLIYITTVCVAAGGAIWSYADSTATSTDATAKATGSYQDTSKVFTAEELAKYNGKNGAKTYVAIDGIVYDLTGVKAWKNGKHKGQKAGRDLTKAIKWSPHGKKVLKDKPVVGKLAVASNSKKK